MSEKRMAVCLQFWRYRGKSGLGAFTPPSAAGIRVNKEKLQKHRHRRILPTVQSLHTTTFRILYPRLVAISEERYWMPWTCAKEGYKTGRILEKEAVCWDTESLAAYHTWDSDVVYIWLARALTDVTVPAQKKIRNLKYNFCSFHCA